jgi:hypothetical protein
MYRNLYTVKFVDLKNKVKALHSYFLLLYISSNILPFQRNVQKLWRPWYFTPNTKSHWSKSVIFAVKESNEVTFLKEIMNELLVIC